VSDEKDRSVRGADRELLWLASHQLPEPVADAATAFFAEVRAPSPDWFRAFHRLIDAFEVAVSFTALAAALSYVRSGVRAASATQAIEALRDQSKLSTGFWWLLLRECLRPFEGHQEALFWPELYDLYFRRDGKVQPGARLLDAVPGLRNRMKGHAFTLPAGRYQAVVHEQTPVIEELLLSLRGLASYPLVRVLSAEADGDTSLAHLEFRVGSSFRTGRFAARLLGHPAVGELILLRPMGESDAREWMSMHPFLVHRSLNEELGVAETGLFQGRAGEGVSYLAVRSGVHFDLDRAGADVVRALAPSRSGIDPARALRSADGKLAVADVVDAAAATTDAFLQRARNERVYLPEAFTDRRRVRAHVQAFLEGDKRLALLAGGAGAGKTSLLCRLAEDFRISRPASPVVLVPAAGMPTAREHLRDLLARTLAFPDGLGKGLDRWRALPWPSGRLDVLILVDGLDRSDDPAALLRALLELARSEEGLRVVVTVASAVLEGLLAGGVLAGQSLVYRAEDGKYEGHAIAVSPLEPDEVEAAYDRYRSLLGCSPMTPFDAVSPTLRAALANPLLLRIACEVFDRKDVTADVTEVDVLVQHARRTAFADPARQDFVKRLVRRFAATRKRRVALRELLDDAFTRPAILSPEGAYQALLRDQVLVEVQGRSAGLGLAPETYVEFSFDATLGYLLLLDRLEREDPQLPAIIADLAAAAPQFAPAAVALDIALRSTPPRERPELVVRILESAPNALGAEIVARFLEWLDAPARTSLEPVVEAILSEANASHAVQQSEVFEELRRLFGEQASVAPAPSVAATFAEELIDSNRLPSDRGVDLALALHRRNVTLLAGLVAHRTLRRAFDELPGVRRREAELVLADALCKVGSDSALQAAEWACRRTCESARAAGHVVHLRRALVLLEAVYALLERPDRRLETCEALVGLTPNAGPERLLAVTRRASALEMQGRLKEADGARGEVARLLSSFHIGREAGEALSLLGAHAPEREQEDYYRRAVAQFQASGDMESEANEHRQRAYRLMHQGSLVEAEGLAKHAIALAATVGALAAEQHAVRMLASICAYKGEPERAEDLFRKAGRTALSLGRAARLTDVIASYYLFQASMGNVGETLRLFDLLRPLLDLREKTGVDLRAERRRHLSNESEHRCVVGDLEKAEELARAACKLEEELPEPFMLPPVNLAIIVARRGRPEEALPIAVRAREVTLKSAIRQIRFESAQVLAEILRAVGKTTEAMALLREEIDSSDRAGDEMRAAPLRVHLAEALLADGAVSEALAAVESAEQYYVKHPQVFERYRSSFALSRVLLTMSATDERKAAKLKARSRSLLQRAGEELNATAGKFSTSPYRLVFLRRNPVARAIREATEEAIEDDSLAESQAHA
jgi:tetratricopeptide (TPR) repeat protein